MEMIPHQHPLIQFGFYRHFNNPQKPVEGN